MWRTAPDRVLAVPCILLLGGCDPLYNIEGAYFPAWLVSGIFAVVGSFVTHAVLVRIGIDRYLWPRPLVYLCVFVLLTLSFWLVFYGA